MFNHKGTTRACAKLDVVCQRPFRLQVYFSQANHVDEARKHIEAVFRDHSFHRLLQVYFSQVRLPYSKSAAEMQNDCVIPGAGETRTLSPTAILRQTTNSINRGCRHTLKNETCRFLLIMQQNPVNTGLLMDY